MNENVKDDLPVNQEQIISLAKYLNDHPLLLVGIGISTLTMGVCIILDNKNN